MLWIVLAFVAGAFVEESYPFAKKFFQWIKSFF